MIGVNLTPTEASALKVLADKEARSLSSMARIILLNALQTAET
jgi:plasmid stability protein